MSAEMAFNADDHDHPRGPTIRTVSGRYIDLTNPDPHTIDIGDIGHALAHINRFTGHTCRPYSVAEHSLHVSAMLWRQHGRAALALLGLVHDASEAYLGDVSGPLKRTADMSPYRELEQLMQATIITRALHLQPTVEHLELVEACDKQILAWEMAMFRDCTWRTPTPPDVVAKAFVAEYWRLDALDLEEAL